MVGLVNEILYRNRLSGEIVTERIFQESTLRWLYETPMGYLIFSLLLNNRVFHLLYAKYQKSVYSRHKIARFITQYEIDPTELALPPEKYPNFNAFFARKLKLSARPFVVDEGAFCAPADGKIIVYDRINIQTQFEIKGYDISLKSLLASSLDASIYSGGQAIVLRLAPYDYHRFHFPDSGIAHLAKYIKGEYHSVNPLALAKIPNIYSRNKRVVTQFDSDNFGKIAYIEVGALTVSSIMQTYHPGRVTRGREKGYFQYGGSTIILLFKGDRITFDRDLLQDSARNLEVRVLAGSRIGNKVK